LSADKISTTGAPAPARSSAFADSAVLGANTTAYIESLRVLTNRSVKPCFQSTSGLSSPAETMKS